LDDTDDNMEEEDMKLPKDSVVLTAEETESCAGACKEKDRLDRVRGQNQKTSDARKKAETKSKLA
jgi:hypothetical protein